MLCRTLRRPNEDEEIPADHISIGQGYIECSIRRLVSGCTGKSEAIILIGKERVEKKRKERKERYIFNIKPKKQSPSLLACCGYPSRIELYAAAWRPRGTLENWTYLTFAHPPPWIMNLRVHVLTRSSK